MHTHVFTNDLLRLSCSLVADRISSPYMHNRLLSLSSSVVVVVVYHRPITRLTWTTTNEPVIVCTRAENESDRLLSDVSDEDRPASDRSKMKEKLGEIK